MNELTVLRERVRALEVRLTEAGRDALPTAATEPGLPTLVAHAPILLYTVATHRRLALVAGAGVQQLGLVAADVVGRELRATRLATLRIETDDDSVPLPEAVERAFRGVTVTGRTPLEPDRVFDHQLVPVRGDDGTVTAVLGIAVDVSERERARRALDRARGQLRHLANSGLLGTASLDESANIIECNPAWRALVGYDQSEMELARPSLWTICHPQSRRELARALRVLQEQGRCGPLELSFADREGNPVLVLLFGACQGPERSVYVLDLSERQQLREQLLQAQKMEAVGRLSGGVAHDFNNMLAVIHGFGAILATELAPDAPEQEHVQRILVAAERAGELTRRLLAFSRQQVVRPEIVNLNNIVAGLEQMVRRLIGEDIDVHLELDPSVGAIEADPNQLEQILLNLVINAREAMPTGGRLTLRTASDTLPARDTDESDAPAPVSCAVFSVSDTGHGMDEATRARIFEPFFSTRELGRGSGLGLSTVQESVAQMGGRIEVETAPGQGATFRVFVPNRSATPTAELLSTSPPAFEGTERILVAEDEPQVRHLISMILQRHGYDVIEAGSGEEAMRYCLLHRGEMDLVVSDIVMPGFNGPELRARLREAGALAPFLFVSGYTDRAPDQDIDPSDVLTKPFLPDQLLAKVRGVLDGAVD